MKVIMTKLDYQRDEVYHALFGSGSWRVAIRTNAPNVMSKADFAALSDTGKQGKLRQLFRGMRRARAGGPDIHESSDGSLLVS